MARTQRSIQNFARVSKPNTDAAVSRKRKQTVEDEVIDTVASKVSKKQKLQLATPPDTPTRAIKHTLSKLHLSSVPTPAILKSSKRKRAASPEIHTPPTPESSNDADIDEEDCPQEIDDLKSLQLALLKGLALHYAHNGAATPVDTRVLSPTITRIWGKRKVTLDDIKLCLGLTYHGQRKISTTLSLSNYGNGKICIEIETRQRKRGVLAQAFDEAELVSAFEQQLDSAWRKAVDKDDLQHFLDSLPRASVPECTSYTKLKPSLAKGQQRLEEVLKPRSENVVSPSKRPAYKSFPAFERTASSTSSTTFDSISPRPREKENTTPPPPTASLRALSLLDRITKKQAHLATLSASAPTASQLARLASLQRAEEMIQILELLATTKGPGLRASFPLPSLIRSVQSSLRSPMSAEEIERCVGLIGEEVARGYVEVKSIGSMRGVVVNRAFRPDAAKVREVVEKASVGGM